jgi:hypothetical protein
VTLSRIGRAAAVGLALAVGGLVIAAGSASADTGDSGSGEGTWSGSSSTPSSPGPGDLGAVGGLTPGGVPVVGAVQAVVGATKVVPGQSGQGY